MDSVGSNNEEELTSTITMGNILSSTNPEEEKEVCDSVPTSSTDAFTNASIAQIALDDPISSTSSDIVETKKFVDDKSKMDLAVNSNHKFSSSPIVSEKDLIDMNITDTSTERITENVDDLVQDLENLLGESTTVPECSTKTPSCLKSSAGTSTSEQAKFDLDTMSAELFQESKVDRKRALEEIEAPISSDVIKNEELCAEPIQKSDQKDVIAGKNLSIPTIDGVMIDTSIDDISVETKVELIAGSETTDVEMAVANPNELDQIEVTATDNTNLIQSEVPALETVCFESKTEMQTEHILAEVNVGSEQKKIDLMQEDLNMIKDEETRADTPKNVEINSKDIELANESGVVADNVEAIEKIQVKCAEGHLGEVSHDLVGETQLKENHGQPSKTEVQSLQNDEITNDEIESPKEIVTQVENTEEILKSQMEQIQSYNIEDISAAAGYSSDEMDDLVQEDSNDVEESERQVENFEIDETKNNDFELQSSEEINQGNLEENKNDLVLEDTNKNVEKKTVIKGERLTLENETETVLDVKKKVSNIQLEENFTTCTNISQSEPQTQILQSCFNKCLVVKQLEPESQIIEMKLETNAVAQQSKIFGLKEQTESTIIENVGGKLSNTKSIDNIVDNEPHPFSRSQQNTSSSPTAGTGMTGETKHVNISISQEVFCENIKNLPSGSDNSENDHENTFQVNFNKDESFPEAKVHVTTIETAADKVDGVNSSNNKLEADPHVEVNVEAASDVQTTLDTENVDSMTNISCVSTSDAHTQSNLQHLVENKSETLFEPVNDKPDATKVEVLSNESSSSITALQIEAELQKNDSSVVEITNTEIRTDTASFHCKIETEPENSNYLIETEGTSRIHTASEKDEFAGTEATNDAATADMQRLQETDDNFSNSVGAENFISNDDLKIISVTGNISEERITETMQLYKTNGKETLNLTPEPDAITIEKNIEKLNFSTVQGGASISVDIVPGTVQCQDEIKVEFSNAVNFTDSAESNLGGCRTNFTKGQSDSSEDFVNEEATELSTKLLKTTAVHEFGKPNVSAMTIESIADSPVLTEYLLPKTPSVPECSDKRNKVSVDVFDDSPEQVDTSCHIDLSEDSNEKVMKDVADEQLGFVPTAPDHHETLATSNIAVDSMHLPLVTKNIANQLDDMIQSHEIPDTTIFEGETVADSLQPTDSCVSPSDPPCTISQFEIVPDVIQSSNITISLNIDSSNSSEENQETVSCTIREELPEVETEASGSNNAEIVSCSEGSTGKTTFTKEQINNDENLETLLAVASLSSSYQASFEEFMFEKQNYDVIDEESVTEKIPNVSSTVSDKKINDDLKLNEPLVINIDDSSKDKTSDTKIPIKSLKATEGDNDEPEESKGTLKMTITKQSDTMHSILKIYQPGDSTTEESEDNIATEPTVPKLIIKPVLPTNEQLESPKSGSKYRHASSTSGNSPRITIKPIVKPESIVESITPLKITIKPVLKPEDISRQKQSPKLTIKPIIKPEDELNTESRVHSPRITIKPIIKPPDECEITPKITIKPIVEPSLTSTPKITIKPVLKPQETTEQSFSPKITIKPIVKPPEVSGGFGVEESSEESSAKERIVLKINKGNLPSTSQTSPITGKDIKKREVQVEKIKLKFSKEGGHPHIVQNDFPNKRLKTDDEATSVTITPILPTTHSRIRELLTVGRTDYSPVQPIENVDEVMKNVEGADKKSPSMVIREDSTQDAMLNLGIDLNDPLSEIPVFAITPDSVKTLNPPAILKPPSASQDIGTIPPTPRKRGRPRKVPLQVREDFKDSKDEEAKPVVVESTRPKRSCRGPSVRMTLGIKPRKPRGPGRGRGSKRGMGTRNISTGREPSPIPAKELKLSLKQQLKEDNNHTLLIGDKIEPTRSGIEIDDGFYKSPISSSSQLMPPQSDNSTSDRADIVMYEEETRMSAEINSRAQTPAKQVISSALPGDIVDESQSSVQSTATTESTKGRKGPRLEVHQEPEGAVISADQLAEYYWSGGGPYMLQEQVAQFLGIKSFKRKYPNIPRRIVDMQERDFIRESGLAGEAMCDLGLTSVNSADILDIMYSDFQDKYEEYCKHQRDRQAKDLINKQKALTLAAMQEKTKLDITQQAVQSAASWNFTFNKARRDQRKACMDLQTLTVHYPKGKVKQINRPKIGNYPIALVPGQFTDYYGEFTPTELNNLPLNTMCYNPVVKTRDLECDSQTDGSGSESDTSSSGTDSSCSSSDNEDCTLCKPPPRKIAAAVQ